MQALALVESPFHLICLNEAINAMKLDRVDVLVITDHSSRNHCQLEAVRHTLTNLQSNRIQFHYGNTGSVQGNDLKKRIGVYAIPFLALQNKPFDRLLVTDFRSQWQKDIAATLSDTDTWLLDDGTATLSFLYYHLPKGKQFSLPVYGTTQRQQEAKAVKKGLGLSTGEPAPMSLFTLFDEHVPEHIPVIKNSLSMLSCEFVNTDPSSAIIIGAKIVERDLCSVDDYHRFVGDIIHKCSDKKIIYIPHRGQSQKFNESLAAQYPQLTIQYLNLPLELWLAAQSCPPSSLHGFVSTAFYVAARAFPQLRLHCYAPTQNMLNHADKAGVYGSNCFTNSEAININYQCLPAAVMKVDLYEEVAGV